MSTGYGWEGIRQVCASFVRRCLVRAMYPSASAVAVSTKGRYNKCSTFFIRENRVRFLEVDDTYIHTYIHTKIYNAQHSQACSSNQRRGQSLGKE